MDAVSSQVGRACFEFLSCQTSPARLESTLHCVGQILCWVNRTKPLDARIAREAEVLPSGGSGTRLFLPGFGSEE